MIISKVGSGQHPKLSRGHYSKFFQVLLHSKCIIDRCTWSKMFCCTSSKKFKTLSYANWPYSVGLFMCPPIREVKVVYEYSTDIWGIMLWAHGKEELINLAAVADRMSDHHNRSPQIRFCWQLRFIQCGQKCEFIKLLSRWHWKVTK